MRAFEGYEGMWSPDGRYVLSASDAMRLWDVSSDKCLRAFAFSGYEAVAWAQTAVTFFPGYNCGMSPAVGVSAPTKGHEVG